MGLQGERVVGVFRDRETAEEVARAISERGGQVRVEDPRDTRAELVAEMREEVSEAWAMPGTPIATKGMVKGTVPPSVVGVIVGAVLFLPGAIPSWGGVPVVVRVLAMLATGVLFGGTLGMMIGGILSTRAESKRLAAERGYTVSAEGGGVRDIEHVMLDHDPIRVDVIDLTDHPRDVVATEEDLHEGLLAQRAGRQVYGHDREDETA